MLLRALTLAVVVVPLATGCAKKREEASPAPPATSPLGVDPPTKCRYESVTAASSLEIGGLQALDLPADKVKSALACSGAPLQECGGTLPAKGEPVVGAVTFSLSVDARGFVTETKVDGAATVPAAVSECATQILKRMDFPAAEKGATTVKLSLQYTKHVDAPRFAGADVTTTSEVLEGKADRPDKVLDVAVGRLRGCYLLSLEREAKASGTLECTLSVGATGVVSDVSLVQRGTLTKDAVACADTVLRATTFPVTAASKIKGTITMRKPLAIESW